jgi:glycosyltransferase involved in cell wall biosynthesis
MTPLVSILIPAYNAAPWIDETLDSALAQTHPRTEIIVVDDGSSDTTLELARAHAARYPERARIVTQPNAGASSARNHAMRLARGDYLQFLDADDLLTPEKIAAQVNLLSCSPTNSLATCRWGRFTTDPARAEFVNDSVFRDFAPLDYLVAYTGQAEMMHPAAWLVPRSVADRAGPWDETLSLNDDGEYFARVVLAASSIVFSNTGASLYRSNLPGSLSRQRSRRALESVFSSVVLIAGNLICAEPSPRVRRAVADYWQRLAYELYPDAPDLVRRAEGAARSFGPSPLRPSAGTRERQAARFLGWKLARRLRRLLSSG